MLLKFRYMLIHFGAVIILFSMLCLGAQNLNNRHSLNLGSLKTVPLPTGFIVGVSVVIGLISGGTTAALLSKGKEN